MKELSIQLQMEMEQFLRTLAKGSLGLDDIRAKSRELVKAIEAEYLAQT